MSDADCVELLRLALPRLGLRWEGFRRVRGQVCKRIERRRRELGLDDLAAYRAFLESSPEEWGVLDGLCRVTISRFRRDRAVWDALEQEVLPALATGALAAGRRTLRAWSVGCASGEEAYSLTLSWRFVVGPRFPDLRLRVLATDVDEIVLARARQACYPPGSLRELPPSWQAEAFEQRDGAFRLRRPWQQSVRFLSHDLRDDPPAGRFDLVLCRNLAFTYFDAERQRAACARLAASLRSGGALVVGIHERLPAGAEGFQPWPGVRCVHRRVTCASPRSHGEGCGCDL